MNKEKKLTKKQLIDKAVNKWIEQNSRYGKTLAEIVWDEAKREALKRNIKTLKYLKKVLIRNTRCGTDCAIVDVTITHKIKKLEKELKP